MSPELVDQAILGQCQPHFYKVARVIGKASEVLFDEQTRKKQKRKDLQFIADRIKALVKALKLESAGNLNLWGYSEIRLTGK